MKNVMDQKVELLAKELDINVDEIQQAEYDETIFEIGSQEYLVVNEEERAEKVKSYIIETIWAFNSSFLEECTELPSIIFKTLSEQQYEDANEPILKLIELTCGLDKFIETAVEYDGYGNFISGYDGNEIELENDFYMYRLN